MKLMELKRDSSPTNERMIKISNKYNIVERKFPKKKLILISGIITSIILIISVFLIIYFYGFKEQSTTKKGENINRIKATYTVNSGEELQLLNPNILSTSQYKITLKEKKQSLRQLDSILDAKSKFDFSGDISVIIDFNNSLNSLESLFENTTQLKQINLTDLDMSEITNMDSMFSGCSSLENIIFDGVDTRKVKSMNYLFKNCKNLKAIDMSPINSQNVDNMSAVFSGCENINSVNISTFPKIGENFLDGVNSEINIISNEKIYDNLNRMSLKSESKKLLVKIIIERDNDNDKDNDDNSCEKGTGEKCKTCSNYIKGNCLLCNDGYFLPIDSNNKKLCSSCSIKDHCIKCIGQSSFISCQECEEGYISKIIYVKKKRT